MGFLSKLMKNPLVQMALPIAMTMFMPGMGAAFASKYPAMSGIFSGMNPMAANMLKQSALGYGTAKLSGSKHPEKAAMYSGLASLPFSYMSAAQSANAFNKERMLSSGDKGYQNVWDVLSSNKSKQIPYGDPMEIIGKSKPQFEYGMTGTDKYLSKPSEDLFTHMSQPTAAAPGADIFTKTSPGGFNRFNQPLPPKGTVTADWIPTMASQTAGMYGGRMTEEEKWEEAQKRRKKELAWMYGVPEDMIEGEMTNPWSSGSFWNRGGIASLENGGDVSGPGSGTSDSINANLSDGEFVMTAKAVENLGNGDRYAGARQMYDLMNVLDPESETMSEVV